MKYTFEMEIGNGASPKDIALALQRAANTIVEITARSTSQVAISDLLEAGALGVLDGGGNVRGQHGLALNETYHESGANIRDLARIEVREEANRAAGAVELYRAAGVRVVVVEED